MSMADDLHPSHEQLIRRLKTVQNTRAFQNVDIISITGAFTDDQLEKYVADKERDAAPMRKPFTTGK
jgi:predicted MPP superfamily phosphohydrolase